MNFTLPEMSPALVLLILHFAAAIIVPLTRRARLAAHFDPAPKAAQFLGNKTARSMVTFFTLDFIVWYYAPIVLPDMPMWAVMLVQALVILANAAMVLYGWHKAEEFYAPKMRDLLRGHLDTIAQMAKKADKLLHKELAAKKDGSLTKSSDSSGIADIDAGDALWDAARILQGRLGQMRSPELRVLHKKMQRSLGFAQNLANLLEIIQRDGFSKQGTTNKATDKADVSPEFLASVCKLCTLSLR